MATEIPTQIEFEHLLSHTFPGFFLAFTIFMLINVWSPYDFTQLVFKDINGLIAFAGFILLTGTICGVIIDNIHHTLIEDGILRNLESISNWEKSIDKSIEICISKNSIKFNTDINLTYPYFFNIMGANAILLNHYIRNAKYCYSEFFSNTFISLIPFALVSPFYLFTELRISWENCIMISIISMMFAMFCLYSSYDTYLDYYQALNSIIRGLDYPCIDCNKLPGKEEESAQAPTVNVLPKGIK